ncbi:hypothetical protein J2851_007084 [Azospirillum rugosum]|uniref:Uncharacterized protein n=1 Tax=Azospirillum rugosum TaxID=416170 RepID=A0ABS4SYS2_9PROT|nr:hypothetical protein [Azospirillum rugosum]MDQ0531102.1 hypothetical protein [Azospirillum rugosum]
MVGGGQSERWDQGTKTDRRPGVPDRAPWGGNFVPVFKNILF